VNFVDQSTGSPTSWFWNFGDGATSTEKNPAHQYMTLGTFTVALTVSNENGQDTATKTNMIETTLAPVAEFKADAQIGKAPFIVQFTDLSKGNPTSWNWEFGDGTSSSEQNPRHVYPNEGAYDVRLTVANQYGSDTIFKTGAPVQVTTAPVTTAAPVTRQTTTIVTTAPTLIPITQSPLSPFAAMLALIFGLVVMAVNRK
jgi:PKD repeat protein